MSKLSAAFNAIIGAGRNIAAPAGASQGKINVVLGKFEDLAAAYSKGLNDKERAVIDALIAQHGGPLAPALQAVEGPALGALQGVQDQLITDVAKALDGLVAKAGASLSARVKDLFDGHPDFDGLADQIAGKVATALPAAPNLADITRAVADAAGPQITGQDVANIVVAGVADLLPKPAAAPTPAGGKATAADKAAAADK